MRCLLLAVALLAGAGSALADDWRITTAGYGPANRSTTAAAITPLSKGSRCSRRPVSPAVRRSGSAAAPMPRWPVPAGSPTAGSRMS